MPAWMSRRSCEEVEGEEGKARRRREEMRGIRITKLARHKCGQQNRRESFEARVLIYRLGCRGDPVGERGREGGGRKRGAQEEAGDERD